MSGEIRAGPICAEKGERERPRRDVGNNDSGDNEQEQALLVVVLGSYF